MLPEEKARIEIDRQLIELGYTVQDLSELDLSVSRGVVIREYPTSTGPVDYLIFIDGTPIGVIEAKEIKKGETIVAGYADVKETRVSVNVIATATVIYFEDYEFTLTEDNDGVAAAFAKECAGKPCRDMGIFKTEKSGIFTYKVRLYFTKVLTVG